MALRAVEMTEPCAILIPGLAGYVTDEREHRAERREANGEDASPRPARNNPPSVAKCWVMTEMMVSVSEAKRRRRRGAPPQETACTAQGTGELVPLAHRDGGFGDFAHDVRHGSTHDAEGFLDDGVQEDVLHLLLVIARELDQCARTRRFRTTAASWRTCGPRPSARFRSAGTTWGSSPGASPRSRCRPRSGARA